MNLAELRSAVSRYGFDQNDPLDTWINAAIHQIEDEQDVDWVFLEKKGTLLVPAGESDVALPADCAKVKSLRDTTHELQTSGRGWPIEILTYQAWNRIDNLFQQGQPQYGTLINLGQLSLYPRPAVDISIEILYHRTLPDIVDPDDVPGIPSEYHYTIVRLAAATGLMAESEEDRASTALQLYSMDLDRMKAKYDSRQLVNEETVVETW